MACTRQRSRSRSISAWLAYRKTPFGAQVRGFAQLSIAARAAAEGGVPAGACVRQPTVRAMGCWSGGLKLMQHFKRLGPAICSSAPATKRWYSLPVMRLLLLLLGLLSLRPAHALGPEGHGLVGDIASLYLAPRTAAAVERLLRHDRFADGTASGRKRLGEIASWADEIRDFNWGKARASWHYDNIPVCETPDPGK